MLLANRELYIIIFNIIIILIIISIAHPAWYPLREANGFDHSKKLVPKTVLFCYHWLASFLVIDYPVFQDPFKRFIRNGCQTLRSITTNDTCVSVFMHGIFAYINHSVENPPPSRDALKS